MYTVNTSSVYTSSEYFSACVTVTCIQRCHYCLQTENHVLIHKLNLTSNPCFVNLCPLQQISFLKQKPLRLNIADGAFHLTQIIKNMISKTVTTLWQCMLGNNTTSQDLESLDFGTNAEFTKSEICSESKTPTFKGVPGTQTENECKNCPRIKAFQSICSFNSERSVLHLIL